MMHENTSMSTALIKGSDLTLGNTLQYCDHFEYGETLCFYIMVADSTKPLKFKEFLFTVFTKSLIHSHFQCGL